MTSSLPRPDLAELESSELAALLEARGCRPFHARQIFRWIYRRGLTDFAAMTDLARPLREALHADFVISTPRVDGRDRSTDGTQKLRLELADGRHVEAVYIPDSPGETFCVSTQVGCAMQCAFCLTGRMGLVRHLTAGEIVRPGPRPGA